MGSPARPIALRMQSELTTCRAAAPHQRTVPPHILRPATCAARSMAAYSWALGSLRAPVPDFCSRPLVPLEWPEGGSHPPPPAIAITITRALRMLFAALLRPSDRPTYLRRFCCSSSSSSLLCPRKGGRT